MKRIAGHKICGVVAIDDAWCLILFAVSLAIAKSLVGPLTNDPFLSKAFFHALLEIGGAFVLGASIALVLSYFSRYVAIEGDLLIYTLGFILLTTGIALYFHLSVLLANMFLGMVLVNVNKTSFKFFDILRRVDSPLYLCFFVLAGANLEIGLLGKLGLVGITYLIFRVVGKLTGAFLGGYLSRADSLVRKYLGFGLIPQAGVALGLALIAKMEFPEVGRMFFTIIVATTIVYEVIGPFCTKFALSRAGEISTN